MEQIRPWLEQLQKLFNIPLLELSNTHITLSNLISFLVLLVILFWVAGKLRKLLIERVLTRTKLEIGARQAVGSISRYIILLVGFLVILQTAGIDLTTLNVLAGAVGIGVGFGLQNVANNFISGLIILFERPIKVGDRIEVDEVDGDVIEIGARSTTVMTNDNIAIIVPNSKFITENVINWKYTDSLVRFHIPIGVAYDSDANKVRNLLLEVAQENENVLKDPPAKVWFKNFGDSSLNFELLVWNKNLVHRKGQFISDLNYAIFEKLNQNEIEIPFPQRDIHIRSGAIEMKATGSSD